MVNPMVSVSEVVGDSSIPPSGSLDMYITFGKNLHIEKLDVLFFPALFSISLYGPSP